MTRSISFLKMSLNFSEISSFNLMRLLTDGSFFKRIATSTSLVILDLPEASDPNKKASSISLTFDKNFFASKILRDNIADNYHLQLGLSSATTRYFFQQFFVHDASAFQIGA